MKIITFFTLCLIMQACGASEECNSPKTQYSMNICSGIKLTNLENELKIKENTLSKKLKIIGGKKLFRISNMAWLEFRNSHCASISQVYNNGSIHSLVESECNIMLTKERINNLENSYKDTINTIEKGIPSANK